MSPGAAGTVDLSLPVYPTLVARAGANVLVEPRSGAVKFVDFGIATLLSREAQYLKHPEHVEGTFEFMSPEQTGRMNRTLD